MTVNTRVTLAKVGFAFVQHTTRGNEMENITFNLTELHKYGTAFLVLALRKQFFVDQLGWQIPHDDDVNGSIRQPKSLLLACFGGRQSHRRRRAMATTAQWAAIPTCCATRSKAKSSGFPRRSSTKSKLMQTSGNAPVSSCHRTSRTLRKAQSALR